MAEIASPRARMVQNLWQLKQVCDQQDDQGLRYLHFNTLLKDPQYRAEIIERAARSQNPKIRELADILAQLDSHDVLVRKQTDIPASSQENPDIAATRALNSASAAPPAAGDSSSSKAWPLALGALLLAAVVVTATALRGPLESMLSGQAVVSGSLFGEQRWSADRDWVLDGIVYVEAGARLVIEPGTRVLGGPGSALVVTRDATLHARGSLDAPIVFTSAQPVGERQAGDWGGLVLLGSAPVNVRDARIEGVPEGDTRAAFGGVDAQSNCGVLEYARIEFAGYEAYANNELNGLTLGGCGSNTIVRNVQVHRALDDGIEVFGGTVDLKQVVITGAADDSLDWDMGWRGRVQFLVVQQHAGIGDNAFEGDNNKRHHDAEPLSEPVFHNVTLVSARSTDKYQRAMTLRRGSGGHFNNVIVRGFSGEAVDIRDASTAAHTADGRLSFAGLFLSQTGAGGSAFAMETGTDDDDGGFDEAAYFAGSRAIRGLDTGLPAAAADPLAPEFTPALNAPAHRLKVTLPEGEFWDEAAHYAGAVRPGVGRSWLAGWTAFPAN